MTSQQELEKHMKTVVEDASVDYPTLLQTVVVRDAKAALEWYTEALNGRVVVRYDSHDDRVLHACVQTGYGGVFAVEDVFDFSVMQPVAEDSASPQGCSYIYLCIPEGKGTCDEAFARMKDAGAVVIKEPRDTFYGHRISVVKDKFGIVWTFAHRVKKE